MNGKETGRKLSFEDVTFRYGRIRGKINTILDASVPDRNQRSAIRSLIHDVFYERAKLDRELCFEGILEPSTYPEFSLEGIFVEPGDAHNGDAQTRTP